MDRVKKYISHTIVFVTLFYIAMAVIFEVIYNEKNVDLTRLNLTGIYYTKENLTEKKFNSYSDIIINEDDELIIKGHFDSNIRNGSKIMNILIKSRVEFYLNHKLLYDSGNDVFIRWDYFLSPGISTEDEIEIHIKPIARNYHQDNFYQYLNNMYAGSEHDLFAHVFKKNIINIMACILIIGIAFAMFVANIIYSTSQIKSTRIYLSCALLLLCGSLFCFLDYKYITLLIKKVAFVNGLDFILKMLYCGLLFIYLSNFIKNRINILISRIICSLWLIFYIGCFIRRFLFLYPNVYTMDAVIGVMGIISGLYNILFIYDIIKSKDKSMRLIMISAILLSLTTIAESIYYIKYSLFQHEMFVLALLIFGMLNLIFMIKRTCENIKQAEKAKELEIALLNSKMDLMISQIKPHFIFNALAVIEDLCDKDAATAKETLEYFSTYLKSNMNSINESRCIPFEKEMRHVESYLFIEKIRKDGRLNVEYDIKCRDFFVPPLTIQTLVENAVKHGINGKENGGTVRISTLETNKNYIILITDDGIGFDVNNYTPKDDGRKHIGIPNTINRIKELVNGNIEFKSTMGMGTTITIKIPKQEDN